MSYSTVSNYRGICQRARPEVLAMAGYASARSLQVAEAQTIFLDANECAFEPYVGASGLSRYPSQQPGLLVDALCRWLDVSSRNLTITRGADEAIDCLMRAFCVPGLDNVVICPPTFAMYAQSAMLQGVAVKKAMLDKDFGLDFKAITNTVDVNTKMIFVCSPNNPTANLMDSEMIKRLCQIFKDKVLIVVDETYIEFSAQETTIKELDNFANLVVLRTLSKSHAAAGLRCGVAVAHSDVSALLQKVLAPYPLAVPVINEVLSILFRPISLSFRLFGNVYGGESLLHSMFYLGDKLGLSGNWINFLMTVAPIPFYFMEVLIGIVQALVFMLLVSVYIGLICNHEEEHH